MISNACNLTIGFSNNSYRRIVSAITLIILGIVLAILANMSKRGISEPFSSHQSWTYLGMAGCLAFGLTFLLVQRRQSSSLPAQSLPAADASTAIRAAPSSLPTGVASAASATIPQFLLSEDSSAAAAAATPSSSVDGATAASAGAPREIPRVISLEPLRFSTPQRDSTKPRYDQELRLRLKTICEENTIDYPRLFYVVNPHALILPQEEATSAFARLISFHQADFQKNYPHIRRCQCPHVTIDRRTQLEDDVAVRINRTVKNKNEEIVIATVGFGGLLGELRLLIKLNEYGFTKFRIIGFEQNPVKIMTTHKSESYGHSEYREVDLRELCPQFIKFFHDHYPEIEITMILPPISTEERDDATNLQLGRALSTYCDQYPPHAILLVDLQGENIQIGQGEQRKPISLLTYCVQQIEPKLNEDSFIACTTIVENLDCTRFISRDTPAKFIKT